MTISYNYLQQWRANQIVLNMDLFACTVLNIGQLTPIRVPHPPPPLPNSLPPSRTNTLPPPFP